MAEQKDGISEDQPFLSRWSQRKQRAEPDTDGGRPDIGPEQDKGADTEAADEEWTANREAAEAIDIDSLDENSDYSPFFKNGVPRALKSAALRQLWRSNPVFANIDGLNDYDEDFTIPKTPMGAIRTAWKFGRGFIAEDDVVDEDGIVPEPKAVEAGTGGDGTATDALEDQADPVRPDSVGPDSAGDDVDPDPAADPEPSVIPPEDAPGNEPGPNPAPAVGLRNRLDFAAFARRDED